MSLVQGKLYQKVVTVLSNASLGVYLVHVMVLDKVYKIIPVATLPTLLVVPTLALITFIISVIISMFINEIPYMRN